MSNEAGIKFWTHIYKPILSSFEHKSGFTDKNKQHLPQELLVIIHHQQHGEENIHHSVPGWSRLEGSEEVTHRVKSETVNRLFSEPKQNG